MGTEGIEAVVQGLHWLGHAGFALKTGGTWLYLDPFRLAGRPPEADVILVSHEHYDHCSVEDIEKIRGRGTTIVAERQAAAKLSGNVRVVSPGDVVEVGGLTIEAVPAYNTNKPFHPATNCWLGFVVEVGGVRIYHAGDTDLIPEMRDIRADIALLPVSGTYVMTSAEAARAALEIGAPCVVPMHYGVLCGTADDAEAFRAALAGKLRVEMLPRHIF